MVKRKKAPPKTATEKADGTERWKAEMSEWQTPRLILDPVDAYFEGKIGLDPCSCDGNPTRARRFFTPSDDGLSRAWSRGGDRAFRRELVFVNPPYNDLWRWVAKALAEALLGHEVILLLSCTARQSDPRWAAIRRCPSLETQLELEGRVAFINPATGEPVKGNNHPSALFFFGAESVERVVDHFGHLGPVWPYWQKPPIPGTRPRFLPGGWRRLEIGNGASDG